MGKADEYWDRVLPLTNGPGTVQQQTLGLSPLGTSIDMRSLFGNTFIGDFYTFKAEGPAPSSASLIDWKAYMALGPRGGALSTGQSGLTPAASGFQAWPLASMQEISGKLTSGKAQTFTTSPSLAGFATMVSNHVLNISCNIGSGLLHVMRATLPESMDAGQFRPPVGSAIFPPGPSGWVGPYP